MKEQKAYIGLDSLEFLKDKLKFLNPHRIFLVHGKKSYENCGAKDKIEQIVKALSASEVFDFSDFSVNPEFNDLKGALDFCEEFKPDLILSVGGGSAIDMAKLIRFFHSYDGKIETGSSYIKNRNKIPLIAIPTTSGTGAEATHFAVLYKDKTKYSVEHDDVLPDIAIIYPPFTYKNSPYLTACTGFDALAQGIEAYWNKNATEESDIYAERAIQLIYPILSSAVNSPTYEVRDKMAEGAYWAGRAINITKTTAPHAFSYGLTSLYGYPHGHAVALTFPAIADFNFTNGKISSSKKSKLIEIMQLNGESIGKNLEKLKLRLGLAAKPGRYDLNILLKGINLSRLANNPAEIDYKNAKVILQRILC